MVIIRIKSSEWHWLEKHLKEGIPFNADNWGARYRVFEHTFDDGITMYVNVCNHNGQEGDLGYPVVDCYLTRHGSAIAFPKDDYDDVETLDKTYSIEHNGKQYDMVVMCG